MLSSPNAHAGNEGEIGEALAEAFSTGLVKREDMFITSKLWSTRFRPELVAPALKQTLKGWAFLP